MKALEGVDFAEVCITSDIAVEFGTAIPEAAFRLSETPDVGVVVERARGRQMPALLALLRSGNRRP